MAILSPIRLIERGQIIRATIGSHDERTWVVMHSGRSERSASQWHLNVTRGADTADLYINAEYLVEVCYPYETP